MDRNISLEAFLPVSPESLCRDWLNEDSHSKFTGSKAFISAKVGEEFSAWDGYITGITLEIKPGESIKQSWRTSEFPPDAEDSVLLLEFFPFEGGTELHLTHSNIPDGQADDYEVGWKEFYLKPMAVYYSAN